MKNEYEFSTMVNNNHQKIKSQESQISVYTDHEIRMACLQRKAKNDQKKANRDAIKLGIIVAGMMPFAYICMRLMIALLWMYSYAIRGF